MKSPIPEEPKGAPGEESPGLPGLRSWRGVYYLVVGTFVLWVVLLRLLTRVFS
jgi:hypothetical protein